MVNGGSGKTFFVKNALSAAINGQENTGKKRTIKYISLYGCKNIEDAITNRSTEAGRESVSDMLEHGDWIDRLEKYVNPDNSQYINDIAVFSKADVNKWVGKIHEADPEKIDDFRHWLSEVYPRKVIRKSYIVDEVVIKEIRKGVSELEETDLIKKASLGWLDYQFGQFIQINESIRQSSTPHPEVDEKGDTKIE